MTTASATSDSQDHLVQSAIRKAYRYLVPLLTVTYILAYLDRANIGFAATTMIDDLAISVAVLGIANGFFYIFYVACEVPSNIMMARFGARIWIPRIMISWGVVSAATMFAYDATSLYVLRAILGIAEAGLFPGIIFYLGFWFPKAARARASAMFLMAPPIALLIGAPLSGLIFWAHDAWEITALTDWQLLFVVEGIPSVLLGIALFFILPSGPDDVKWLTDDEKQALKRRLAEEHATAHKPAAASAIKERAPFWRAIQDSAMFAPALAFFCLVTTVTTAALFMPLIIRDMFKAESNPVLVNFLSATPPLAAIISMILYGIHSDRRDERIKHTIVAYVFCAVGWVIAALAPIPAVKLAGLMMTVAGAYSAMVTFWAMATEFIPRHKQAIGLALVGSIGSTASLISPAIVGFVRDSTGSFTGGMWYAAVLLAIGAGMLTAVHWRAQRAQPELRAAGPVKSN